MGPVSVCETVKLQFNLMCYFKTSCKGKRKQLTKLLPTNAVSLTSYPWFFPPPFLLLSLPSFTIHPSSFWRNTYTTVPLPKCKHLIEIEAMMCHSKLEDTCSVCVCVFQVSEACRCIVRTLSSIHDSGYTRLLRNQISIKNRGGWISS